jgi:hypothetical protein
LLGLAPLGYFLGFYLDGAGNLPRGSGLLISGASMFLLPWIISALFLRLVKPRRLVRVPLFFCTLAVQALLFPIVPAGATSEMMGIAHRLRRQFPPDQMLGCAALLLQKQRDGSLLIKKDDRGPGFFMSEDAVVIEDSELPISLRGRFARVFIEQGRHAGEQQVYFSFDERTGIVCDKRKHLREFFVCSMAEGVHAYRYQRL